MAKTAEEKQQKKQKIEFYKQKLKEIKKKLKEDKTLTQAERAVLNNDIERISLYVACLQSSVFKPVAMVFESGDFVKNFDKIYGKEYGWDDFEKLGQAQEHEPMN